MCKVDFNRWTTRQFGDLVVVLTPRHSRFTCDVYLSGRWMATVRDSGRDHASACAFGEGLAVELLKGGGGEDSSQT